MMIQIPLNSMCKQILLLFYKERTLKEYKNFLAYIKKMSHSQNMERKF